MDDGEEEMGFDAFPCIISTGFFFDFFSGLVPIFHMHIHCLCLRMAHQECRESLALDFLLDFQRSLNFTKLEKRNASPVKCLLKLLPFMVSIVYWDPSHFHLISIWNCGTNQAKGQKVSYVLVSLLWALFCIWWFSFWPSLRLVCSSCCTARSPC